MSRKAKPDPAKGTYALCISMGFILGIGLGPILGAVLISAAAGALLGTAAGYYFTHMKRKKHKH